jgi:quercetin dioxygenase-like cupin family protein
MKSMLKMNFDNPDKSMQPAERIKVDVIVMNELKFQRVTAQPGWKWSIDLKPVVKTDSCPMDHLLYMLAGTMEVRMDDGQELQYNAGDLAAIPPGHDGWGIGDEATIWIEIPH